MARLIGTSRQLPEWTTLVILLGTLSTVICSDPCQSSLKTLREYEYRDIDFFPSNPDDWENICDARTIVKGDWYRVSPNNKQRLAETCPKIAACGTVFPIWLGGSHPTDDIIKEMKVFMNFRGNCNYWDPDSDNTVYVKKCLVTGGGHFYIYRLPDAPFCDTGYCTEEDLSTTTTMTTTKSTTTTPTTTMPTTTTPTTTTTCAGIQDPNRDGACLSRQPLLTEQPTIEGPYLEDGQPAIYCNIRYIGNDVMARERFYVTFVIGDRSVKEIETERDHRRVKLPPEALIGRMGNVIYCKVTSAWSFRRLDRRPYLKSANNYYLGIQISNNRIDVYERDEEPIKIWPYATLPVTCAAPLPRCSLSLRIIPKSPELKSAFICRYTISEKSWNTTTKTAKGKTPLTLKGRTSPLYSGTSKTFQLQFMKLNLENGNIWDDYTMEPITVHYYDSPFGLCKIELDTYVTTFDKRQYGFPGKGELLALKSSTKRIYEVQIRTKTSKMCFGGHACVCGVAVREGNSIAILDACNDYVSGGFTLSRTAIYRYDVKPPKRFRITRDGPGKRFSFNLPSGAHVVADVKSHGLDVFIHTTSTDYGSTSGLCGSYDGNPRNDPDPNLMSDITAFRIQRSQSFFDKAPDQRNIEILPVDYCSCSEEDTFTCGAEELIDPGSYAGSPGVNGVGPPGSAVDVPEKITKYTVIAEKDVDQDAAYQQRDLQIDWSYPFDYGDGYTAPPVRTTWPTPSGLTEYQAKTKCQTTLRKLPFYAKCRNVVGIGEVEVVVKCVKAIQRTDNADITSLALASYEHECFFGASSQEKLRKKTSDGDMGILDQSLFNDMCPGNCNGHGDCSSQQCSCYPGYRSSDCHLPEDQLPTIHDLINGNMCDVRERPCRQVAILASNVTDDSSLTCRITFVDWNDKLGVVYTTKATLRTSTEVVCELPDSPLVTNDNNDNTIIKGRHYWSIEISNDGERYQGGRKLLVWDSKCLSCNNDNSCIVKTGTCLINNRCYGRYESNSLISSCSRCDPSVSTTEFTSIPSNRHPVLSGPFTIYKLRYDDYNSYLLATDSDSQNELSFSLDSSLVVSGISLMSRGLLRVSSEVSRDVTIKVKVTDSCGASDRQTFRINTIDCGCMATSSCSIKQIRSKTHQYLCDCDDSCTIQSTEKCLSPACPEGVRCQPNPYRTGFNCQCKTRSRESRCSIKGLSVWTEWGDWSGCSKQCDYGIRTRLRECLGCLAPEISTELCNKDQCTELKAEQPKGVIVKVQVADDKSAEGLLKKQDTLLEIIRQFINEICTKGSSACCGRDVWLNPLTVYNFVPSNNIWLANGYPKVSWYQKIIRLKVLATIPGATYQQYCIKNERKKRSTSPDAHYIPSNIIKEAVTKSIGHLEQSLHVKVIDVTEVSTTSEDNGILYAAVGAGLVLICIIIAIIIVFVCRRNQKGRSKKASAGTGNNGKQLPHPSDREKGKFLDGGIMPHSESSPYGSNGSEGNAGRIRPHIIDPRYRKSHIYDEIEENYQKLNLGSSTTSTHIYTIPSQ